jgi:hypothetical protein
VKSSVTVSVSACIVYLVVDAIFDECMIEMLFEASHHREKFLDLSLYVLLHSAAISSISWDMLSIYSLFAPSLSRALKKCLVLLSLNAAFCVFHIGLFGTFHNLPW